MAVRAAVHLVRCFPRSFSTRVATAAPIRVGERLPNVHVYERDPQNAIDIAALFQGKKGVLFSIPGAFTPGCSQKHIPEYLQHYEKFEAEGYSFIACVSVNDPFVMSAYGDDIDKDGKIHWLADMKGEFTKALDMELDCTPLLGNVRSKTYFLLVEDGIIKYASMNPDHTGLACLLCITRQKQKKTAAQRT